MFTVRICCLLLYLLLIPFLWWAAPLAAAPPSTVTLAEAIRLAEQVQPTVVQAEGSLRSAGAQVRAARGAYLPSINATSGAGKSFSEGGSETSVSMGLSAGMDLFTGFRQGADLRTARAEKEAAQAGLVDARFQANLTTTREFLNALYSAQLVRVREAGVRRAEEQLKVSVNKLHSGSATRSDSLRSLVTLGTARLQLVTAGSQLAAAEANLGRLVGADSRVAAQDDSSLYAVAAGVDEAALRSEAESRSPKVQAAVAKAASAVASLSAARAAYWPTVTLSGSSSYSGSAAGDYELFNQRQLGLQLSWPLFNRFARERTVANQTSNLLAARAQAADARRQVSAALTTQSANLEAARARIEIAETSVRAAEEDLRVQSERYRLGAATIVDVLTSQEALGQAEVDVVNARFDYLRAKAEIEALIGRPL